MEQKQHLAQEEHAQEAQQVARVHAPRYINPELRWGLIPVAFALALIATVWLRYAGQWAEIDTIVLTQAARGTAIEGTIQPEEGVYVHGFLYPSLVVFLADATGLSISAVQTTVLPWCLVGTAVVAFVAFRAITGDGKLGAICSLLLMIQADFLFVYQRGSHEKVTWTLVLVLVYALVTSFRQQRFAYAAPLALVFYLSGFALISTNAFFATSLVTSFLLAFVGGSLVTRWFLRDRSLRPFLRRFGYVFATLGVLSYLYIAYLYPPVQLNLANLDGVVDRVAALYLDVETSAAESSSALRGTVSTAVASPYTSVSLAWTNPRVFFVLTSLTWILIACAALAWFVNLRRFFLRGVRREEVPLFLVWMFSGATGLQIVGSVVADAAGALGSNLQLRLFPAFTLFIIPLVVGTFRLPRRLRPTPGIRQQLPVAAAFAFFAVAAYLKSTNDPLVSNKWVFYTDAEAQMMRWADNFLPGTRVWSEFDERLLVADVMVSDDSTAARFPGAVWVGQSQIDAATRYVVVSDVTARRALRLLAPVPDTRFDDRIYDNGRVQVDHRVPESPYVP
jgi:hypothetical protein